MCDVKNLIDKIGREKLARALGHSYRSAVDMYVVRGMIPAQHYLTVKRMAAAVGEDAPESLFGIYRGNPKDAKSAGLTAHEVAE